MSRRSKGHSINVIVPAGDFYALREYVKQIQRDRPDFSLSELVRQYIREGLASDNPPPAPDPDPRREWARLLHLVAHNLERIARELEAEAESRADGVS